MSSKRPAASSISSDASKAPRAVDLITKTAVPISLAWVREGEGEGESEGEGGRGDHETSRIELHCWHTTPLAHYTAGTVLVHYTAGTLLAHYTAGTLHCWGTVLVHSPRGATGPPWWRRGRG